MHPLVSENNKDPTPTTGTSDEQQQPEKRTVLSSAKFLQTLMNPVRCVPARPTLFSLAISQSCLLNPFLSLTTMFRACDYLLVIRCVEARKGAGDNDRDGEESLRNYDVADGKALIS